MNGKYFISIVAGLTLLLSVVRGQDDNQSRVMAEISGTFMDYRTLLNGELSPFNTLNPGITMAGHVDATRWLDASLFSTFAPEVDYPANSEDFIRTSLVDVRAMARIKSNGTLLRSDALVAPYLATGFGFNIASSNFRPYIPAALGVRLQLSENFALQFEGMYKQPLSEGQIQHLAYSAGFVFGIPKRRAVTPEKPKTEPTPDLLADADNDGVPDIDDTCPDEKGKALNFGCPDSYQKAVAQDERPTDETTTSKPVEIAKAEPVIATPTDRENKSSIPTTSLDTSSPKPALGEEISQTDLAFIREAGQRIYFAEGSAQLTPEAMDLLDQVAAILQANPGYQLQVMGYTDNGGTADANKVLSVQRGFAVKKYLVYSRGLRYARIFSDGKGAAGFATGNHVELIPLAPGQRGYRGE